MNKRRVARRVGGAAAVVTGLMWLAAFVAIYGHTSPSYVGMTRDLRGALNVLIALCPGETIRSLEVAMTGQPHRVWRISGKDSTRESWVVGEDAPEGFVLETAGFDPFETDGTAVVRVHTDLVDGSYDSFEMDDVHDDSVLFEFEHVGLHDFPAAAFRRYPCDDPEGRKQQTQWFLRILLVSLGPAAISAALLWRAQSDN